MTAETLARQPADSTWFDGKKYLVPVSLAIPTLPFFAVAVAMKSGQEIWYSLGAIVVFIVVPLMDRMVGSDHGNPPESLVKTLQQDKYYQWVVFLYLPLEFGGLVLGCWVWTTQELGIVGRIGLLLSVSVSTGIAINTAHELGHKLVEVERWLSKIALAPTFYGHFYVEHNYGHHTRIATPDDPASARIGENFYRFWPRTVWGSLKSAVRIEWRRHRVRKQNPWTLKNHLINAWLMSVVLFVALTAVFGFEVLPFLILQAILGFSLLEVVNYIEHYGLARQKNERGKYGKVEPKHSWNSDRLATNMFLIQLQRHSDHHANPTRRYQALRTVDEAPQMPGGYASMIVMAVFPPVWKRIMDPIVVDHYDGDVRLANIQPGKEAKLLRKFPPPVDREPVAEALS